MMLTAERSPREVYEPTSLLSGEVEFEGRDDSSTTDAIVGDSPAIQFALTQARRVAETDATVLVLGETGTGTEPIASYVHQHSQRRHREIRPRELRRDPVDADRKRAVGRQHDGAAAKFMAGNFRELRNAVERAMILAHGRVLRIPVPTASSLGRLPSQRLIDVQKDHIRKVLETSRWRVRGADGAAERLGLRPTTLETRMARLGLTHGPA